MTFNNKKEGGIFIKKESKKKKKKSLLSRIDIGAILKIIAIIIFSIPFALSFYSQYQNEASIKNITPTMTKEERKDYNESLKRGDFADTSDVPEISSTPKAILSTHLNPVGAISIPKIKERLPLYMGITEDALALGTAILDKTSYPTGEPTTNTVITGHRGTPNQNIFKNLDLLEKGDYVYIDLDEPYILRYKVTNSEVVEPHQSDKFQLFEGRSMITLVTCTPYLINSHRILTYCDFDAKVKNPNYGENKSKEQAKQESLLVEVASEKDIQVNEETKQEVIINVKKDNFIDKIRLMNPVNVIICIVLLLLLLKQIINFLIPSRFIEKVVIQIFKVFATWTIVYVVFYIFRENIAFIINS